MLVVYLSIKTNSLTGSKISFFTDFDLRCPLRDQTCIGQLIDSYIKTQFVTKLNLSCHIMRTQWLSKIEKMTLRYESRGGGLSFCVEENIQFNGVAHFRWYYAYYTCKTCVHEFHEICHSIRFYFMKKLIFWY